MKIRTFVSLFTLTFLFVTSLRAELFCDLKNYSFENGLLHHTITGITQDQRGLIWIGTWNGISSYDGYKFLNYRPTPGDGCTMNNNRINYIKTNIYGNIWCINQDERAYLFDVNTKTYVDVLQGIEEETRLTHKVSKIYVLPKGITWVVCNDSYCFRVEDKKIPDKQAIKIYSTYDKNLKSDVILNIHQDKDGNEWILTDKGINIIGDKSWENDYPFRFFRENKSNIYLASERGKLASYNKKSKKLKFIELPENINNIYYFELYRDSILTIGTDNGVILLSTKTNQFKQIDIRTSPNSPNDALQIYMDKQGGLWIQGQQDGVIYYSDNKIQLLQSPPILSPRIGESNLFIAFEDPFNNVWVVPRNGNLCYYDRKSKQLKYTYIQYDPIPHLSIPISPGVRSSFIDNQGNLWTGTNIGLNKLSFFQKQFVLDKFDDEVRALYIDKQKRKWVCSKNYTVHVIYPNGDTYYLKSNGELSKQKTKFNYNIYSILEDSNGIIWLGSRSNGLFQLTPINNERYDVRQYLPKETDSYSLLGTSVYALMEDSRKRIWVGTYDGGLNLMEKNGDHNIRFINSNNQLKNYTFEKRVRYISENKDGIILVGGSDGLITFSSKFTFPEEIKFYRNGRHSDDKSSLSGNEIMYIFIDSRNDIFLITQSAGVNKIVSKDLLSNDIVFEAYNASNGLESDLSQSMIEDKNGQLWFASKHILSKYNPKTNTFEHYGKFAFKENVTLSEATIIQEGDQISIGCNKGILSFNTKFLKKSTYSPKIILTDIRVMNHSIKTEADFLEKLVLSPKERNISIHFSALDYYSSGDISYRYKLEGVDKDWNEAPIDRIAQYNNLPNGQFRFIVQSTNSDGIWCENTRTLPINVKPLFSETIWIWVLFALLVGIIVAAIAYTLFIIYRLRHKVDLEQELSNIKLRFFTDVSHELRTPLSLISGPVNEVLEEETLSNDAKENLTLIKNNTDRMLYLVNQILDFRKIQNKKMKVLIERCDIVPLIKKIMANFTQMAQHKGIELIFDCQEPHVWLWIDIDKFEKIVYNLLSNAFKYTEENKPIKVKIISKAGKVSISIIDNGIGIPEKKLNQIFDRFFMTDDYSMQHHSTGIGLSLVKELVDLHHAALEVFSKQEVGSEFRITFLEGNEHFEKDEKAEFIVNDENTIEDIELKTEKPSSCAIHTEERSVDDERPTILIVEDNDEMLDFLRRSLSKEYQVITAINGAIGLDKALNLIPDLIISDYMMPQMDGLDMVKAIKKNNSICHIPIVILSAKDSLDARIAGLESGIDDYITKPFSMSFLRTRIKSLLNKRRELQETFLSSLSVYPEDEKHEDIEKEDSLASIMPSQPNITSFDKTFIDELMSFMEKNMDNDALTVDDMSEALSMSRTVFYRKIKSLLGISPVDFIKDIRVKRAVQLIESSDLSLSEIAYMCGFSDPNYFGKCFKKQMGITPSKYKEQMDSLKI